MTIQKIDLTGLSESKWLELRHPFVGASESPVLLGDSYAGDTVWDLWHRKRQPPQLATDEIDDRIWFGRMLQPVFGEYIRRRLRWDLKEPRSLLIDRKRRMSATLDFICAEGGEVGIVETKNRDYMIWRDRYTETDAWVYDKVQLAHQMMLMPEATWGAIVVLVGGNTIEVYRYTREDLKQILDDLPGVVANFWLSVDENREPEILAVDLPTWALERGPVDMETAAELPDDIDNTLQAYRLESKRASASKKESDRLKAKIIQLMGHHKKSITPHHTVGLTASLSKEQVITADMVGKVLKKEHYRHTLTVKLREDAPEEGSLEPFDDVHLAG
jgi:predicted phage-related endonuclease